MLGIQEVSVSDRKSYDLVIQAFRGKQCCWRTWMVNDEEDDGGA